jgi:hypothetical protein
MPPTKVKLSDQHYMLDGLVYSNAKPDTVSPLTVMATIAGGDDKRLEELATKFNLVLSGTTGVVVSTTTVNRMPCYSVQFDGIAGPVTVPGKFIQRTK